MKVLVFGGAGFLGSHVSDALSDAGHAVTVFDVKVSPFLRKGQKMLVGDIQDEDRVRAAVAGSDVVYNFAGIADLQAAHDDPVGSVRSNILGNCIILEACVKAKVKRYVFASTLYVYSQAGSFYSISKRACETYIENYHRYHGLAYTILRYGSLYGSRAGKENGVGNYLRQALTKKRIIYHGNGEETREYIHVDDAARYSVEILAPEFANQHLIITGHQAIKVRELLEMISEILGGGVRIRFRQGRAANVPDTHYARTPYNFTPRVGRKLIGRHYIDLGQGLLGCIEDIHAQTAKTQQP
ncbi:MAG: NAD(P)-dependent oxidoreductase [Elusimicrobia bacterium]|nr:NAD(P)-dependent oxidoreductase [Elusimicrobiota bacterium]